MGRADSEPGGPGAARAEVSRVGQQRGLRRAVLVARKPGGRCPAIRLDVSAARKLYGVREYADDVREWQRSTKAAGWWREDDGDRKSTRLNSSHLGISYAVFCLKKKTH